MKPFKRILTLFIVLSILFTVGCAKKGDSLTLGKLNGNTYTNSYFSFTMETPKDWTQATSEQIDQITNIGNEVIANGDEKLSKQLDLSKQKTLNLVYSFKHPLDYAEGVNANLVCIAENLGLLNSIAIKSGSDYLDAVKQLVVESQMPYTFSEYSTVQLGGKDFTVMDSTIEMGDIKITQRYYTTIMKGYAVNFIILFSNDDELNELQSSLNTIKFE